MRRDTLLPAAVVDRVAGFPLGSVAVLLLAWSVADRDGICTFQPEWWAADVQPLFCGLLATYPGPLLGAAGGREYAWLPDVSVYAPPTSLRRAVGNDPAPPQDLVRAVLAVRLGREPTDAECRHACPRSYGGKRAAAVPTDAPEDALWLAYARHVHGDDAEQYGLGPAGRRLIRAALAELGGGERAARDLACLFDYVFDSDERGPKWLRDNKFTGLDNLTVLSKLRTRVDAARTWADKTEDRADTARAGVDLGPLGAFRRRVLFTTE